MQNYEKNENYPSFSSSFYLFCEMPIQKKSLSADFQRLSDLIFGWGTRTRTRKGRTRICSVTITPYPKKAHTSFKNGAKVRLFLELAKFLGTFL